jgi:hypothetical protein
MERSSFTASEEEHWISSEFDEFLAEISRDGGLFFASFDSLKDLMLPCD